jgi:hypothetical protein
VSIIIPVWVMTISVRRETLSAIAPAYKVNIQVGSGLLEAHCLGILIRRPELVFHVDRALHENHLTRLSRSDFERSEYQAIFELVEESLAQDHSEPMNYVLNGLSLPLMEIVDYLFGAHR